MIGATRDFAGRRGFALISSLAAVVMAMMLLGAFFITHRSFLALSRQSDDRTACRDTVLAVMDYCRYRVEREKTWTLSPPEEPYYEMRDSLGRTVFTFLELTAEEFAARPELQNLAGMTHIVGSMPANDVRFHLAVSNNLGGADPSPDGVAKKSCRLRIEATRGTATERTELILRKVAFFDSTVFASKDIGIAATDVIFSSTDPVRNQVRSMESVHLPDIDQIQFRPGDPNAPPVKGTVWSKGEIALNGDNSLAKLQEASQELSAEFVPNSPSRYTPPLLDYQDVLNSIDLPSVDYNAASYVFSEVPVTYEGDEGTETGLVKALVHFDPEAPGAPPEAVYLSEAGLPPDWVEGTQVAVDWPDTEDDPGVNQFPGDERFTVSGGPTFQIRIPEPVNPGEPAPPWEPLVSMPADSKIQVDGKFSVMGGVGTDVPEIMFESSPGIPGKGVLSADSDIYIGGNFKGTASLVSAGDITLTPQDIRVLADMEADIALFANNDVIIEPRYTTEASILQEEKIFAFRGLVYAGRDFRFSSTATSGAYTAQYERELNIEGALCAHSGAVAISGTKRTEIKYNPDYLDKFLENLSDGDEVDVEELSWRPL